MLSRVIYPVLYPTGIFAQSTTAKKCVCHVTPTQEPNTQDLTGFGNHDAYMRGCRRGNARSVLTMVYGMPVLNTPENLQNQCASLLQVYIQMTPDTDGVDFLRWFEIRLDSKGLLVLHNGHGASIPRSGNALPLLNYRVNNGESLQPLANDPTMVNAGPVIANHGGKISINYWQECGWKAEFNSREFKFTYAKSRYGKVLDGVCGQCGDEFGLDPVIGSDYWLGGIAALAQPFRLQEAVNNYCSTDNMPQQGLEPSIRVPECTELQSRQLSVDGCCGFIINREQVFGHCMRAPLTPARQRKFYDACKRRSCQVLGTELSTPQQRQTLCTSLEDVGDVCHNSGWDETDIFQYCAQAP